jgi:hypothetical protein
MTSKIVQIWKLSHARRSVFALPRTGWRCDSAKNLSPLYLLVILRYIVCEKIEGYTIQVQCNAESNSVM